MTTTTVVRRTLLALFLSVAALCSASAQFDFARYKPLTLDSLMKRHKDLLGKKGGGTLSRTNYLYRIAVQYGDSIKPTDPEVERLIEKWFTTSLRQKYPDSLFASEMLFYENDVPYWIPVQQHLVNFFTEEVTPGDRVEIYVTLLGATKKKLVLTLNEFKKLE
jgi:hypothetical protein